MMKSSLRPSSGTTTEEDLTRLLLPIPASCWHTPPVDAEDPRGRLLCQALWAFVQPLGDPVPTTDCERDLVVLEFHGDHSARIADALFELRLSAGRKVTFLPAPLPAELKALLLVKMDPGLLVKRDPWDGSVFGGSRDRGGLGA